MRIASKSDAQKSFASTEPSEERCGRGANNKAKEKGTSPNFILCIYFPVHNDKIKTNTFNLKTKPYAIEHVSKKVKYNNIQLMMHRNHMLIMPQKHINSGLIDKSNITHTSKNKITGKKLSKKK